ncbi:DNA polymerase-4 [Chitinophaga skermanii]|uniref:DNA polymerase IV n=1 Tax=Chitinophaga skermanii TaxID=331697 RepID=A0A327QXB8_9BACT|nr:DNA polymerase IV [Chitinophaga skermanii]RAJ08438.1 DNA polymerase-4 [Chitinophaga skermanii]
MSDTSPSPSPQRKIIHIDMDAFYASVEQRDNPELRGKAIAVGGSPTGRGVVATASYEARKFGVRSAMSSRRALQLCPHIVFVRPRFAAYKEVSQKVREIFRRYTDLIEPLSLDEAYLDVTEDKLGIGSAIEIAQKIKDEIFTELHLTASAGVSINKFVAKVASDLKKPNGLTFIGPSGIEKFMEQLAVEKFHGVGKVTAEKMKRMNLHTGADLKRLTENELVNLFGKVGRFYYRIVRGIDNRPVEPHRETKSVGAEDTFEIDTDDIEQLNAEIDRLSGIVAERLQKYDLKGKTVTLKVKYSDFKQITRNHSIAQSINDISNISHIAKMLLEKVDMEEKKVRLLGVTVSNFPEVSNTNGMQLELF